MQKKKHFDKIDDKLSDYGAYFLSKIIDEGSWGYCGDESYGSIQKIANFGDEMWIAIMKILLVRYSISTLFRQEI